MISNGNLSVRRAAIDYQIERENELFEAQIINKPTLGVEPMLGFWAGVEWALNNAEKLQNPSQKSAYLVSRNLNL
jgi:hypothetical protein